MKKIKITITFFFLVLFLNGCTNSTNSLDFDVNVDKDFLDEVLTYVISEENQGRLTGTEGNENVMEYIKTKYEEFGLVYSTNFENYEQTYSQKVRIINQEPELNLTNQSGDIIKEYEFIRDFGIINYLPESKVEGKITTGAFSVNDTRNTDIITNNNFGLISLSELREFGGLVQLSTDFKSSCGFIIEYDSLGSENRPYNYIPVGPNVYEYTSVNNDTGKMNIFVTPQVYDEIVSETSDGAIVNLSMDTDIKTVETGNIIGYVEGKEKDEYVFITAHLDHVGSNGVDSYNPGALDNGSGISALLEIARIVSQNKDFLNKTVVFIAFNGEEEGLYGSSYFVEHSPFSLKNAQIINLDMVGSTNDVPLNIDYCDASNQLKSKMGNLASEEGFNITSSENENSDHGPFCHADYSAITLINLDLSSGYHSPDDIKEDVDIDRLSDVVKLVVKYIDMYA